MTYPLGKSTVFENDGAGPLFREDLMPAVVVVGEMRFWPFRPGELPGKWYACNGDKYSTSSAQGIALAGLSANFKADWGIAVASSQINLPNVFDSGGGGYFVRAGDGSTRQVGTAAAQGDAIRNITGFDACEHLWAKASSTIPETEAGPTGAFYKSATYTANNGFMYWTNSGGQKDLVINKFDASRAVPTAAENRPLNVAMTMAIYLGV
jgi:hypothetical protein